MGFTGQPFLFCYKWQGHYEPFNKERAVICCLTASLERFSFYINTKTFLLLHQAFLGTALKYSSLEMSDTPPYHFWSQICCIRIVIKNHSYWRGHFLITGCLQKQRRGHDKAVLIRVWALPEHRSRLYASWSNHMALQTPGLTGAETCLSQPEAEARQPGMGMGICVPTEGQTGSLVRILVWCLPGHLHSQPWSPHDGVRSRGWVGHKQIGTHQAPAQGECSVNASHGYQEVWRKAFMHLCMKCSKNCEPLKQICSWEFRLPFLQQA